MAVCWLTQGLDDLGKRCAKYYEAGARFAKWRAVLKISASAPSPLVRMGSGHALSNGKFLGGNTVDEVRKACATHHNADCQ